MGFTGRLQKFLQRKGLGLDRNVNVGVGIEGFKKDHAFDLGSLEKKVLVECKSHRWTAGSNVPSAKLTVWNEAMYYFVVAPEGYRKIMFVLKYFSTKTVTLAEYYIPRYKHLIPSDLEYWEYSELTKTAERLSI